MDKEQKEKAISKMLIQMGFCWIAREEKYNELIAYTKKPFRIDTEYSTWDSKEGEITTFDGLLPEDVFTEITATDPEAFFLPEYYCNQSVRDFFLEERETVLLKGMVAMGLRWAGRDGLQRLSFYTEKPVGVRTIDEAAERKYCVWNKLDGLETDMDGLIDPYLSLEIQSDNEEATNLMELLQKLSRKKI